MSQVDIAPRWGEIMQRYTEYATLESLHSMCVTKTPDKLQLGAVMPGNPPRVTDVEKRQVDRALLKAGAVEPRGGPLVIDMDLDAFPRTCQCHKHTCCDECWSTFMPIARRVTEYWLKEVWSFERILCVFSGCRGVHYWILDDRVISWSAAQRVSFIKSIMVPVDRTGIIPRFMSQEQWAAHYPRYDEAVTASVAHLKGLPLMPHQKTRRLSVPLPPVDGPFTWLPEQHAHRPLQVTPDMVNVWIERACKVLGL